METPFIPPVDEQFVSDAWNTLDPKPTAHDIAELWVDQQPIPVSEAEFEEAVKRTAQEVEYYLP
jgi:hypothetical protein